MFILIAIYISAILATKGLNLTLAFVYFLFNCKLYYMLWILLARVMTTDMSKIFEAKFQAKHYLN